MPRNQRAQHLDVFAPQGDFNDQLYDALRQAPWWMISIAIHVVVFVIASLLMQHATEDLATPQVAIRASDPPPQEELPEVDPPTKPVHATDIPTPVPVVKNQDPDEHPQSDDDLPNQESLGQEGLSDAPYRGPADNGSIGIGGGAGGAFPGRGGSQDKGGGGGGAPAKAVVENALNWLAAHQSPSGAWEAGGFDKWCDHKPVSQGPDGLGKPGMYDPGVTGLALCAFLGAGYTNRGNHHFSHVVARGLQYLKNVQDPEGCFGPRQSQHFIYNHATASLAMVEAYGMTESPIFKRSAQKALDFIALARNPYFAWRYGVKPGDNDTSCSGWMMMALKSAKLIDADAARRGKPAPLLIDEDAFDGVRAWVDQMTDQYGRTGYVQRGGPPARPLGLIDKFPGDKSESMTGVGMLARIFTGEDPRKSEVIRKGAEICSKLLPTWNPNDGSIDMYYWYYATLAMYQVGGAQWDAWNKALKPAVIDSQRQDTDYCMYKGSWDPIGPWGPDGGRVYSTALLSMCLEVYYRYDRVFGTK